MDQIKIGDFVVTHERDTYFGIRKILRKPVTFRESYTAYSIKPIHNTKFDDLLSGTGKAMIDPARLIGPRATMNRPGEYK